LYAAASLQHGVLSMGNSKGKAAKIEGIKKHKEKERVKKKAMKDRKKVMLPVSYKKKK
jgi:hypothetical protein